MFGKIELANIKTAELPQKAASAWSAAEGLVGASYRPLLFIGQQIVNGTNYFFIAEQTLSSARPIKHIAKVVINEMNDEYKLTAIEVIIE